MRMMLRTILIAAMFVTMGLLSASPAAAQVDCGTVQASHVAREGWHFGDPAYEMIARTWRDIVSCPLELQTEGWVNGYGGAAEPRRGEFSAEIYKVTPVPPGNHSSTGRHWLIWYGGYVQSNWHLWGHSFGDATISAPAPDPAYECAIGGGTWDGSMCQYPNSPIIIDMNNDGYNLTSARKGVFFDIDADGTKERVSWTHPNSDEVFLAMDRNGNGKIDDGSELFGDATPMYADLARPTARNGFDALMALERPEFGGGRADLVIDKDDGAFENLYLWRDENHDGESQPRELTKVKRTDIVGFATASKEKKRVDEHGNEFRFKSEIYVRTPNGKVKAQDVWDIWLHRDS